MKKRHKKKNRDIVSYELKTSKSNSNEFENYMQTYQFVTFYGTVSTCLSSRNDRNSGLDGDLLLSFNDPVSL